MDFLQNLTYFLTFPHKNNLQLLNFAIVAATLDTTITTTTTLAIIPDITTTTLDTVAIPDTLGHPPIITPPHTDHLSTTERNKWRRSAKKLPQMPLSKIGLF
jgi:hypothetical protein